MALRLGGEPFRLACPELVEGASRSTANFTTLRLMHGDMLGQGAMLLLASAFRRRISIIALIFASNKFSI